MVAARVGEARSREPARPTPARLESVDWNWSFKAFRLFGTDVRIHWTLPAFLLFLVMRGINGGGGPLWIALQIVLPMVVLFGSVVLHEFGHVFAARHFGQHTGHMILTPFGGMVMVAQGSTPWSEFVVAFGGPAVNLGLATLGTIFYLLAGGPLQLEVFFPLFSDTLAPDLLRHGDYLTGTLAMVIQYNVILFLFNMVTVAYPMDGGRILMAALWSRMGFRPALVKASKVARIVAIGLGALGVLTVNFMLVMIAFFVFFQANTTLQQAPYVADPGYGYRPSRTPKKPRAPNFIDRWRTQSREKKIRALLAKAEMKGLDALTEAERDFLKRARELN